MDQFISIKRRCTPRVFEFFYAANKNSRPGVAWLRSSSHNWPGAGQCLPRAGQLDPGVANALNIDARKITDSLRKYQSVINAMREIFGDAGHPNAPVPELLNALNSWSGGALSQLQPGQVEMMVRTSYNMAKQTGLGPAGLMMIGGYAQQQAAAAGINPVFGALAAQLLHIDDTE
jgi:hypothetical protein